MAINFQTAAFLAGLKMPSQIMYCISQDNGAPSPVVVYKDSQNIPQSTWMPNGTQSTSLYHPKPTESVIPSNSSIQISSHSIPTNVLYGTNGPPPPPIPPPSQSYGHTNSSQLNYIQVPPQQPPIYQQHHHQIQNSSEKMKTNEDSSNNNDSNKHYECAACKKTFRLKSTLMQHERIHLDSRPYICNFNNSCHKSFRQKSHLIQHSRIHFDSKPYSCNFVGCGKSFRQKAILSQHERIHCESTSKLLFKNAGENATLWPFDVPYPNENDTNKNEREFFSHSVFGNLTNSESTKSEKNEKIVDDKQGNSPLFVRCPICDTSFKQKSTLLQHGCIHIESRPYPCLYMKCGKRFRQQSHLAQHIRIHKNEKPYICPFQECQGRSFRQRTILNQHIRIHTNSKPYHCNACGKDFRQQAILSQHEKTHQSHRPFECPLPNCKRRFVNEQVREKFY